MRKLLISVLLLLVLPIAACMAEMSVPALYLCDDTLLVTARDYGVTDFLALCPEADGDTLRNVTPPIQFILFDVSARIYADASGSTWLLDQEQVIPLTTEPGWRVTSATPVRAGYQAPVHILFTRQGGGVTEVCCYDRATAQISVLHTSQESLVLAVREPLFSYDPFRLYDYVLLCTAEITQPDAASPVLAYHLTEVVGNITYLDDAAAPVALLLLRYPLTYPEAAQSDLADFTAAYKALHPGHNVTDGSIMERIDWLDDPTYGRVYEISFNGSLWLWRDGEALLLAGDDMDTRWVTGLSELLLTDLNGDGTEELVYVYNSGSGILMQHAAYYDPVAKQRTDLYSAGFSSRADELHLQLTDGACLLFNEGGVIGQVTVHGLDKHGFGISDLLELLGF